MGLIAALALAGCSRARAEEGRAAHEVAPSPSSSVVQPQAAPAAPSASAARRAEPALSPAEHDRRLLPCPGGHALCEPELPIVARGVLARAEAYLADCRECRHRDLVKATAARTRRVVARDDRAARRRESAQCRSSRSVGLLVSPDSVATGMRPRVVLATDQHPNAKIEVRAEKGGAAVAAKALARGAGYRVVELAELGAGSYRALARDGERVIACQRFTVTDKQRARLHKDDRWRNRGEWNRASENLYSAWIATSFDAPEGKRWQGLAPVLTDRKRNFLHDHLGLGEDDDAERLALRPDCADAPFVLRAYFAWKLGLPFGHHTCGFGAVDGPPRCGDWTHNETRPEDKADAGAPKLRAASRWDFRDLSEQLLNDVTARTLRTELGDDETDLYPVALDREHLRPGVVFSDPFGHTLTLVKWIPQTPDKPGKLLAVDAQPDGTVGIRRFWRGNFLFVDHHPFGGFGFKAFRPIAVDDGEPRLLSNDEIAVADGYGGFSLEQRDMEAADFYATLARLISPRQPPPEQELDDLVAALMAQLERRVTEVQNAEDIVSERKTPIEMPEGREIFRTTGAWEAVSTPCRDMRLLVGIDTLLAYPEEAARLADDDAVTRTLRERLESVAKERFIAYPRSDGSKQRLSLAQIIARRGRFEMAYNPNDCPELRWGAAEGSAEASTCKRRASEAQKKAMERMRHWFSKRYSCG